MKLRGVLFGLAIGVPLSLAQAPPAKPQFDVAAIRLNNACNKARGQQTPPSPGRLTLQCQTVKSLIQMAYGFLSSGTGITRKTLDVSGGPAWMTSDYYDIAARAEDNARVEEMGGPMMQALLEDRFQLKVHRESKQVPVYLLTVAKGGSKLVPTKEGSCVPMDLNHLHKPEPGETPPNYCENTRLRRQGTTMILDSAGVTLADLAGMDLFRLVDRPIVDQTGLTGQFDIHVEFTPEALMRGAASGNKEPGALAPPVETAGPSIFTALQEQLGLKLAPGKGSVDVLVVDSLERPSEN